ncbi:MULTISPECIES: DegT/DnrJ/EryC1/StrS family aminotransferase [Proteiniphilum]|jgi:dTDP-4-amino-4,6-dideoxygalactose transaminase|uniref:DegT/DnrJ/EryC1/StrS family aminotransferase n=1 Tax=Proteiniphilum TaxID=294702 RepID=UPI001EEC6DB2|nr:MULTISPECIES: DegT/DnrJ/EryC1/StrS family aminotransferase [Proteiniphilum]ULB35575.1 DegT/DnrJ/EryC1/StrS family aminotransferase [Proteiniphilum propionicum]
MKTNKITRRSFLTTVSAGTALAATAGSIDPIKNIADTYVKGSSKLAALGGEPLVKNKVWPKWPYVDEKIVERISETVRSGKWNRIDNAVNGNVARFEKAYADLLGVKGCVTTGSGTQALHTVVEAMGFGPGDEIITSPYTDMGTISSIISARALPVLVDLDRESFQLDPKKVEKKVNRNTKAIMPVHMMGQPVDMSSIMSIAGKHNLKVIEDACQAHLAEYQGKRLGTIGDAGCFSFQTSKTICCGEGGGIISNNEQLLDDCYTVMNHGTSRQGRHKTIGPKYRMNEFEAAVLLEQITRAEEQFEVRNRNAAYLSSKLKGFKGLVPQKLYKGTTKGSFYLYTMAYHKEHWNGVHRDVFLKAVSAEGINLSPYIRNGLHREPWTENILARKEYKAMYTAERLRQFKSDLNLPNCDWVCDNMVMLWASGPLLATEKDMDDVINAIMKVYENRGQLHLIS